MPPEVQDLLPAPIPTSPGEEYVSNSPPITLTRSPANMASSNLDDDDSQTAASGFLHIFKKQQKPQQEDDPSTKDEFHPYVQTLSIADLESCIALENAAFPEDERCSREKFIYRLSTCSELSLGLFSTIHTTSASTLPTYPFARAPNSATPSKKSVLIAHIIATKCDSEHVTDSAMDMPSSFPPTSDETRGHREQGRTLAVHSVAVLPEYQGRGVGKTILQAYLQRMNSAGIADRVALLAHRPLCEFYRKQGFTDDGANESKLYGGGWINMVYKVALRYRLQ